MTPFEELAGSREYWLTKIQNELYDNVERYLEQKGWTRTQLAEHLGVSKGYVSQILNGDFDHKLSKMIDLSLAVGIAPNMKFQAIDEYITDYLSGYDGCLNADNVLVNIQVTNTASPYTIHTAAHKQDVHLMDNETFVTYQTISKDRLYAR